MRGQFQRTASGPFFLEKEMQARNCLPLFFSWVPRETVFSLDTLSLGFRAADEAGASH